MTILRVDDGAGTMIGFIGRASDFTVGAYCHTLRVGESPTVEPVSLISADAEIPMERVAAVIYHAGTKSLYRWNGARYVNLTF